MDLHGGEGGAWEVKVDTVEDLNVPNEGCTGIGRRIRGGINLEVEIPALSTMVPPIVDLSQVGKASAQSVGHCFAHLWMVLFKRLTSLVARECSTGLDEELAGDIIFGCVNFCDG